MMFKSVHERLVNSPREASSGESPGKHTAVATNCRDAGQRSVSLWQAATWGLLLTASHGCLTGATASKGVAAQRQGGAAIDPPTLRPIRQAAPGPPVQQDSHMMERTRSRHRTLYFMPQLGLCNQLQAMFSAGHWALRHGASMKIVVNPSATHAIHWADEDSTRVRQSFPHLFARPAFHWVEGFPGIDMELFNKNLVARGVHRDHYPSYDGLILSEGVARHNCTVHWVRFTSTVEHLMNHGWQNVGHGDALCLASYDVFTPSGRRDVLPMYRELQLVPKLERQMAHFQSVANWSDSAWICAHVRRTDLGMMRDGRWQMATHLIPLSAYVNRLRALVRASDRQKSPASTRIFLATDDAPAQQYVRSHFLPNQVVSFPKAHWGRSQLAGLEAAAIDLTLLSKCPWLVGTHYSSFSATAALMGDSRLYEVKPSPSAAAQDDAGSFLTST